MSCSGCILISFLALGNEVAFGPAKHAQCVLVLLDYVYNGGGLELLVASNYQRHLTNISRAEDPKTGNIYS